MTYPVLLLVSPYPPFLTSLHRALFLMPYKRHSNCVESNNSNYPRDFSYTGRKQRTTDEIADNNDIASFFQVYKQ